MYFHILPGVWAISPATMSWQSVFVQNGENSGSIGLAAAAEGWQSGFFVISGVNLSTIPLSGPKG